MEITLSVSELLERDYSDSRTLIFLDQLQLPDYETLKEIHGEDGLKRIMPFIKLFDAIAKQPWTGSLIVSISSDDPGREGIEMRLIGGGDTGVEIDDLRGNLDMFKAQLPDDGFRCQIETINAMRLDLDCISDQRTSPGHEMSDGEMMYRIGSRE